MITAAAAIAICFVAASSFAEAASITYNETGEEASAELREHMKNREENVTIGIEGETDQDGLKDIIGALIDAATKHTGEPDEGDYISFQYASYKGLASTGWSGFNPVIEVEYDLTYYDDAEQEAETDKKVEEIMESLDLEDKTQFEKIRAIYDYICDNVEYELDEDGGNLSRTAYGALVEGKAVCQGYSVSLYRLLLEAGIDNRIIFGEGISSTGNQEAHTWNIVELEGKYYYLDATWDDATYGRDYFLRPAGSEFEKDHIADEKYKAESFTEKYPISEEEYSGTRFGFVDKANAFVKQFFTGIINLFTKENG